MASAKKLIVLTHRRLMDLKDRNQNARWARFMELAQAAFEWRDHESLDDMLAIIHDLRPEIEIIEG